jgi:hypothetical protein
MRRRSEVVPPASAAPSEGAFNKIGEARNFAQMLKALLPFISQDVARPALNALYIGFATGGDADPIRITSKKDVPELTVIVMPVRA